MSKIKFILLSVFLININVKAENYVDNISDISNLAESTVKAAVSQLNNDTDKVLNNLNNEIQNLSSSNEIIESALETSISEAKKVIEFARENIEKGNLSAAVQSLNLVESMADIAITSVPSTNVLNDISLNNDFSNEEISALTSVAGQMSVQKVLDVQKMAGQMNVVSEAGLNTSEMMKNLDEKGVGIGSTLTSLDNVGIISIENITGKKNFEIENFDAVSFSSMDVVEIGMTPTMMHGALNALPLGSATKALETLSNSPEKLSSNIDPSLITSEAIAETISLSTKSIAKALVKKGLSQNTLGNIGKDLNLNEISNITKQINNESALTDLNNIIQDTGIDLVSNNLELAFSSNKLGIAETISKNASQISQALSKRAKKEKIDVEKNNVGLKNLELPEDLSDTSLIVGSAILSKPNLAAGVQGLMAPPEELKSGGLISDSKINVDANLTNVDQSLITSNAMKETLGAMTKLDTNKLEKLGIDKIVSNTGLTPGLIATLGSAGINGLDVTTVLANNVAGMGSESIQKLSKSISDGSASSEVVADLVVTGSINQGTLGLVGEIGVKNLSEAMGINNENNAIVSLSGGLVGSGELENLENIDPEVVESLGLDPNMITSNAIAETMIGVDLVKMSSAISNGMNLSDALEASSLIDIDQVENNLASMALSQTMSTGGLIDDADIEVTADISGIDKSLVTSNAMAETLGQAAQNMEQGMALDPDAPTSQPGYQAIDPSTGEAPKP
tara:strand:- start:69 stop:2282 length:2214 start_codon:yes stop_codon:yes gene_type:complete